MKSALPWRVKSWEAMASWVGVGRLRTSPEERGGAPVSGSVYKGACVGVNERQRKTGSYIGNDSRSIDAYGNWNRVIYF